MPITIDNGLPAPKRVSIDDIPNGAAFVDHRSPGWIMFKTNDRVAKSQVVIRMNGKGSVSIDTANFIYEAYEEVGADIVVDRIKS